MATEPKIPSQADEVPRDPDQLPATEVIWTSSAAHVDTEPSLDLPPEDQDGRRGYQILECLGHGGMSVIYKAKDLKLNRVVALKMILAGKHNNPRLLNRFYSEASIIARLHHPNIIQIYEVGEYQGLPYLALEFCGGGNLQTRHAHKPLPPRHAAALVEDLARAIHIAHQVGIIHRDLKPANILFLNDGTPKISDFGLAKQLDAEQGHTRPGFVVGTPSYMAPEQSGSSKHKIGPATDVYALGAILYQLLTGRPPFQGTTSLETLVQVMDNEPVHPLQLQPRTPRDLDTICLKCLQKEPVRRYANAAELAEDLRRFRAGEPIQARPVSWHEKFVKAIRRRPAVSALTGLALLLLLAGVSGITLAWHRAESLAVDLNEKVQDLEASVKKEGLLGKSLKEKINDLNESARKEAEAKKEAQKQKEETAKLKKEADEKRKLAEAKGKIILHQLTALKVILSREFWDEFYVSEVEMKKPRPFEQIVQAHYWLDRVVDRKDERLRFWEWHYLKRLYTGGLLTLTSPKMRSVTGVGFSKDGTTIFAGGSDKILRFWGAESGQPLDPIDTGHEKSIQGLTYDPAQDQMATWDDIGFIKIWDAKSRKLRKTLSAHSTLVAAAGFSPGGEALASVSRAGSLLVWGLKLDKELFRRTDPKAEFTGLAYFPKGDYLAVAVSPKSGGENRIALWDTTKWVEVKKFDPFPEKANALAVSPDGRWLAAACAGSSVRLWDTETGKQTPPLAGHEGGNISLAFAPGGQHLIVGGRDGLKMFHLATHKAILHFKGHLNNVSCVSFSPDGQKFVSGDLDGAVKIWDANSSSSSFVLKKSSKAITAAGLGPLGKVAWVTEDGANHLWDVRRKGGPLLLEGPKENEGPKEKVTQVMFSPGGDRLALGSEDGRVTWWDTKTGKYLQSVTGPEGKSHLLDWTAEGPRLYSMGSDKILQVMDAQTGAPVPSDFQPEGGRCLALGKNGTLLACVENTKDPGREQVTLWDIPARKKVGTLTRKDFNLDCLAFTFDGKRVATGDKKSTITIWDPLIEQPIVKLRVEPSQIKGLAFSPEGDYLLSVHYLPATEEYLLRLWDGRPSAEAGSGGQ